MSILIQNQKNVWFLLHFELVANALASMYLLWLRIFIITFFSFFA